MGAGEVQTPRDWYLVLLLRIGSKFLVLGSLLRDTGYKMRVTSA